jgi:hypothetical protein
MAKKLGSIESDVIFTGSLLLGGYFLVKNMLPDLLPGLGLSPQDRMTLDQQQNLPITTNIFNPGYPSATAWATANYGWSQFDNSNDYLNAAYTAFIHGTLPVTDPIYPTMNIYYTLYKGLVGHLIDGDQSGIASALNAITNKWQVGIIADMFASINGQDFWHLLRYGQFTMIYGLNGTDLAAAVTRLNSLPE